jgi:aminoglycoside phosphotransferase family enzyme
MNAALPSLASKVAFLSRADSYREPVHRVECIETHMSWVFLAGNFAYKLKKPVCTDYVDFRPLAARHHFCNEELRLNRRLAQTIYIDVVPLVLDKSQHLHVGGEETAVDWLIKMHRVPTWLMLDFALMHRSACARDAARIAQALARFHQALPAERMPPLAYRTRFARQIEADRSEFHDAAYGSLPERTDALCDAQSEALRALGALLDERTDAGDLVEGHGDLRPEHVCLLPEIAVIDCLEFSRELRVLDKADEAGYLGLECAHLGAPQFAQALAVAYAQYSGDHPWPPLLHFYQSCRARKRALLALRHVKEEQFRYSPHWRRTASAYLDQARDHALACQAR